MEAGMWSDILVGVIVAAAVLYTGVRLVRRPASGCGCGCGNASKPRSGCARRQGDASLPGGGCGGKDGCGH